MDASAQKITVRNTAIDAPPLLPSQTVGGVAVYKVPANAKIVLSVGGQPLQGNEIIDGKKLRLKKIGANLQVATDDEVLVILEDYYSDNTAAVLEGEHWPEVVDATSAAAALLPAVGMGWSAVVGGVAATAAWVDSRHVTPANTINPLPLTTTPSTPMVQIAPTGVAVNAMGTTVTGTARPGASITALAADGTTVLGSATTDSSGHFAIPLSPALNNGQTLSVAVTGTGLATATTAPDTSAPVAPSLKLNFGVADGTTIAEATAATGVVSVMAETGVTTTVTFTNGSQKVTKAVTGNGSTPVPVVLTSADLFALGDGPITVSATATDAAGNTSSAGTASFTLDTGVPATPTLTLGTGVSNGATAAEAAAATGVVSVIAETGATTVVSFANGANTVSKTVTGNGSTAVPVVLASADLSALGDGPISVSATATDAAGNTSSAGIANFTLDTGAPAAPTLTLGTGVSNGATAAEATAATGVVSVTAEAGTSTMVTFTNGSQTVTKTVTGNGSTPVPVVLTSADLSALGDGPISVSASSTDAAGNASSTGSANFTLDTGAPAAPTLTLGTGVSNGATAAEATAATGVISVIAETGATTVVSFANGANTVSKTVTGNGSTAVPVVLTSADLSALGDGPISVSATATDAAGNASSAGSASFTLDTDAPAAPTLALGTGVSNGATAAEATAATGVVSVTAETGATTVVSFASGANTVSKTVTGNGSTPVPVILTGADLVTLGDGPITVSATATDAAGNARSTGTASFTLDVGAPATPTLALGADVSNGATAAEATATVGVVSVTAEAGASTVVTFTNGSQTVTKTVTGNGSTPVPVVLTSADLSALGDGPISVSATATDAAGNASSAGTASFTLDAGAPAAPTLALGTGVSNGATAAEATAATGVVSVIAETGAATVVNFTNGSQTVTKTVTGNGSTPVPVVLTSADLSALGDGSITVSASSTDAAGNTSSAGSANFTLDTGAPTGTLSLVNFFDSGSSASDGISNNNTFTLSLTPSEAGTTAVYQRSNDGGVGWTTTTSSQSALANGNYQFRTLVSDAAGNTSISNTVSVTVDTVAPTATATLTGAADNLLPTVGNVASGGTTNDRTLGLSGGISGTLEPGATLHVFDGATDLGAATVSGATWSLTTSSLANGSHSFTVRAVDVAGNLGTPSAAYTVTVDAAEQVVNTTTAGLQSAPLVVAMADGGYFMVWNDGAYLSTPQGQVRGQFLDANGDKVGNEVTIGTALPEPSANMDTPVLKAVALSNGQVAVAWQTSNATVDGSGDALVQSIVSTNGTLTVASSQTTVNTTSAGNQSGPVMAVTANGGYFIAWYDDALADTAGQVRGQFFGATGQKIGSEVAIGQSVVEGNNSTEMPPLNVLALSNGNVVVSWQTQSILNAVVQSVVSIQGTTTTAGTETAVTTTPLSAQSGPAMTGTADGGYFTAWYDTSTSASAGRVHGQFFNSAGQKVGNEVAIGTSVVEGWDGIENPPLSVLALSNGKVAVAWQTYWGSAVDGDSTAVATSLVTINGTSSTATAQSVVNTTTATAQSGVVMTATSTGGYFMAWFDSAFADPAGNIRGQFFNAAGQKVGSELTIGKTIVENYWSGAARPVISVATLNNGDIVVGWASQDLWGVDGSFSAVLQALVHPPVTAPVVLDLNRDGVLGYGHVAMDVTGDGTPELTAWAGPNEGVLVWDKLGDGVVHDNRQYAFAQYGGTTDLQGLAARFDTHRDGVFDAQDALFGQFKVWQDANQNGVSDPGEVKSLADWGITAIQLSSDGVVRAPAEGVVALGQTTATRTDGSTLAMADVAFEFKSLATVVQQASGNQLVDLSQDPQANTLKIELSDVLAVDQQTQVIKADTCDVVQLDTTDWINTGTTTMVNEHTYTLWAHAGAHLLIDAHATVEQPVL